MTTLLDPTNAEEILGEALILRGWGWCPFPVDGAKRAIVRWKTFQHRRPTDREIGRMFRLRGVAGIAVIPGQASGGLACRDFDIESSYRRWAADHPRLAEIAPTVRTRRGYHVYIRSRTHRYCKFDDGELIGDNRHIVIVPPSRHPSGTNYQWVNGFPLGISEFPLLDLVAAGFLPRSDHQQRQRSSQEQSNALCAISPTTPLPDAIRECILRSLPQRAGQRNAKIFTFARCLRDHVPEDAQPGLLYDAIQGWWQMARPVIETEEFAITLTDFRRAWSTVQVPMWMSRPKAAMARAATSAATPREKLEAACRALTAETGGEFHLSVRTAGSVAGVPYRTAARHLRKLVGAGFLEVVQQGSASATKRIASWYRVNQSSHGDQNGT